MANKTVQEAWLEYCKIHGMDSMNRNTYAIFKAGWNAGLAATEVRKIDEWQLTAPEDRA